MNERGDVKFPPRTFRRRNILARATARWIFWTQLTTKSRWTRYMCKNFWKLTWCSKGRPRSSCCSYQCWMTTELMNYYLRRCWGERKLPHYILPRYTWWHSNFRCNELKCPYQNQPPAISIIVHFLHKYRSIPGVKTLSSLNQVYALGLRKQIQILYYQTWGESPQFCEVLMLGLHYWIISFLVCRCRKKSQTMHLHHLQLVVQIICGAK